MAVEKPPLAVAPAPHASEGEPVAVPEAAVVAPPSVLVTQTSCAAAGVAVRAVASATAEPATRYFLIVISDFTPLYARMGFHSGKAVHEPPNRKFVRPIPSGQFHPGAWLYVANRYFNSIISLYFGTILDSYLSNKD